MHLRQGLVVAGTVPWRAALPAADAQGFDFVELDMEQAFPAGEADLAAVEPVLDDTDLDVVVHLPYKVDLGSPLPAVREGACRALETAIDAAADRGVEKGVLHATCDAKRHTWGRERLRECLYDSIERLSAYGADAGVEVCVENVKGAVFDASDFPDLFAATAASACLDTGHAAVSGLEAADQAALLGEHPDRFSHVHLNDTRHTEDDEHLPVGLGRVDFAELVAAMREADWAGTCTHEPFLFDLAYARTGKEVFDRILAETA